MSNSEEFFDTPDDAEQAVLAQLESIVGDIAAFEAVAGPRWRRIVRALYGLGLLDVVGRDWVRVAPEGLVFGDLSLADADRLARRLEDLENGRVPSPSATPPPHQPRIEFPRPVLPPSTGVDVHHFGAWR